MKLAAKYTGFVHSIESLGTIDGPGVRTVVFLQGCPLKCKFCHNIDCAVQVKGDQLTVEKLAEKVLSNRSYWKSYNGSSGVKGGVTVSGGEPTYQPEFLCAFLAYLKNVGVHTAVDTCLVTKKEVIDDLLPYVDLWMTSIKHMDAEKHKFLTGSSNKTTLENLTYLDNNISKQEKKSQIRIRFLVVPGLTNSEKNIRATAEKVKSLKNIEAVEVLGYGSHGRYKWIELFGKYELEGVPDATEKDVENARKIFREYGIRLVSSED